MLNKIINACIVLLVSLLALPVTGQEDCKPIDERDRKPVQGEVLFDYGSTTNAFSFRNRSDITIGQPITGQAIGRNDIMEFGFWTRLLLAPLAPNVRATQGELLDRIQLNWSVDPLSPPPLGGFNIYRDGIFIANVGQTIRTYNDFNVIAGTPYNYSVTGVNPYGEGSGGTALGFQVPNGTITGLVQTVSGNPVKDAQVTLTPMQGFALKFEANDGAFIDTTDTGLSSLLPDVDDWSVTFWVKNRELPSDTLNLPTILDFKPASLAVYPTSGRDGVSVSIPGGTALRAAFPDSLQNNWNHIGITFDGRQYRLYIDGVLADLSEGTPIETVTEIKLGAAGVPGWSGSIDELRIYHRLLDELDYDNVKNGTASTLIPDSLKAYWRMDEGEGQKAFDLFNRAVLTLCGASFDEDRPPVKIAGVTNDEGFYRIESANYGTGTTFLAKPSKNFYAQRALKFDREEGDYAILPDFGLEDKATLELWVNSAGPDGRQVILSKNWNNQTFNIELVQLEASNWFQIGLDGPNSGSSGSGSAGITPNFGMGYQHVALTIDNEAKVINIFKNGEPYGGTVSIPGNFEGWTDSLSNWVLGASASVLQGDTLLGDTLQQSNFFGGLIAEIAVYDTILDQSTIQEHVNNARDPQEPGLQVYFNLNEGSGNRLNNSGSTPLDRGETRGTEWSNFAPNQMTTPHEFIPAQRQVTLNPSITSVDQVDFTDISTIPISGFVRYAGTDCFAPNVEILVNGETYTPAIFTDSTGRFSMDFDPGATVVLSPRFEDHQFLPASLEFVNLVNPVSGVLFSDQTKRTISGQVAGGLCRKSIIDEAADGVAKVKISSPDGCYEREITLTEYDGLYKFENVPPLEQMVVAITEHSDPDIASFFQAEGGVTVDISDKDTIVDFIYFADPQVAINGLEPVSDSCETIVLEQGATEKITLELFEQYVAIPGIDDGICKLDTGSYRIINGFADEVIDTILSGEELEYAFKVGTPNPSPPYLKTLQVIGTSLAGQEGSASEQAIITGILNKTPTFTTQLPETPWLVLRDPPGDASYTYWEENSSVCNLTKFTFEGSAGLGGGFDTDIGPDVVVIAAPLGVGIETETESDAGLEGSLMVSTKVVAENTIETCITTTEKISTSSNDKFVGKDGNVYVGAGINIQVGLADKVDFDFNTCTPSVSETTTVEPLTPTTFMYSQYHVENNVIRLLDKIANDTVGNRTATDSTNARLSSQAWKQIISRDSSAISNINYDTYKSFDAGVTNEFTMAFDTTEAYKIEEFVNGEGELNTTFGVEVAGVGVKGNVKAVGSFSFGVSAGKIGSLFESILGQFPDAVEDELPDEVKSLIDAFLNSNQTKKDGVSIGYVLSDDDIGDAFAVAIGRDEKYKTPVFKLQAGQSSCPWEPGTANREFPNLQLGEGEVPTVVNVPANEAAVFQFNLGNLSASSETMTYGLTSIPAFNPDGAVIQVNGTTLNGNIVRYTVPQGASIPVTVTVKRGPEAYEYDSLAVMLYSECEADKAFTLGVPADQLDPNLFSIQYIGVNFIRPCSEVDINVPNQGWVVDSFNADLRITVSGYNLNNADFESIRVQYRRTDGDGAWINIQDVPQKYNAVWYEANDEELPEGAETLNDRFTKFSWNIDDRFTDGEYEIRAVALCSGNTDMNGFSEIIKGRIDRRPPSLVGITEPADGVFHIGDEISATFNKPIDCARLVTGFKPAGSPATTRNGLYVDGFDGSLIGNPDVEVTCYENKLVINPIISDNSIVENKLLRVELTDLQDLTGNKISDPIRWEFFVDRNELAWLTDSVGMTKYEDERKRVLAKVYNRSGTAQPFSIEGVADWVRVFPDTGYLVPNEVLDITFEVAEGALAFGDWSDTIFLKTYAGSNPNFYGGEEPLKVGTRVICRAPGWAFDPNEYQYNMNLTVQANINGQFSSDEEDIVVALINGEVRGKAHVEFVPELADYYAFLTIYGDTRDFDDVVELRIWDASTCLIHEGQFKASLESEDLTLPFEENGSRRGIVQTNGELNEAIPVKSGWNWISFNLDFADSSLNAVLKEGVNQGNVLRSQNQFSSFRNTRWLGSLRSIEVSKMYLLRSDRVDTLNIRGRFLNPATPVSLEKGWNWIGYLPNFSLPLKEALQSFEPDDQDIIKSQTGFAIYEEEINRWIGNLKVMEPLEGYQLFTNTENPSDLIYPDHPLGLPKSGDADSTETARYWTVEPHEYEFSMTLIGMVTAEGLNITNENMELGAFLGDDIRGSARAIPIPEMNSHLFFLTCYSNTPGEWINFKLYNSKTAEIANLTEQIFFASNLHSGEVDNPVPFTFLTTNTSTTALEKQLDLKINPNPFNEVTMFQFSLPYAQEFTISIMDISGKEVNRVQTRGQSGLNTLSWNGQGHNGAKLESGLYLVRLQTQMGSLVKKVILTK